ncbi:MAG: NAD(P)H-binding protein [Gammaproteobacteria bacterium]
MTRVLVTGANGHLGRRLITVLPPSYAIEALVRSERARDMLLKNIGNRSQLNVTVADPRDPAAIAELSFNCERAVHLIGTIKETRNSSYVDAHEIPAQALVAATPNTSIKHIVYISILGAARDSTSRCLRSRATVENMLMAAQPAATIIRVPMVLGEKDRASFALAKRASAKRVVLFRADSLEQPIYAGDVVDAIARILNAHDPQDQIFDLAGPQSLSHRELVTRAALLLNNRPTIYSLPLGFGLALARSLELTTTMPQITCGMLRVLDHDDAIDPTRAVAALGIRLTQLDQILRRCVLNRLS